MFACCAQLAKLRDEGGDGAFFLWIMLGCAH
jgi:hypothetical protein